MRYNLYRTNGGLSEADLLEVQTNTLPLKDSNKAAWSEQKNQPMQLSGLGANTMKKSGIFLVKLYRKDRVSREHSMLNENEAESKEKRI
jgi:hypothetical protein